MAQTTTTGHSAITIFFFDTTIHHSTNTANSFAMHVGCLEAANFRVKCFCFRYVGYRDISVLATLTLMAV